MRPKVILALALVAGSLSVVPAEAGKGCPKPTLNHSTPAHLKAPAHTLSCGIQELASIEISKDAGLGRIELHGDLMAVLQRDEGIVTLVDVANPERPKVLGRFDNDAVASLDGDLAFSADGDWLFYARQTDQFSQDGFHVLDVSDPSNPTQAFYQPQGGASRVAYYQDAAGEWVFGLDATLGFTVSRFEATTGVLVPVYVDAMPALKVGGPASAGFEVVPDDRIWGVPTLYVTTGRTGLQIFDISDPTSPALLAAASPETGGWAEIEVADKNVYAAAEYWFTQGEPLIEVLNRHAESVRTQSISKSIDPLWHVQGMEATSRFLYVAHSHAGLVIFDTRGAVVGNYQSFGTRNEMSRAPLATPYTYDVEVQGKILYVSDAATGTLTILRHG